MTTSTIEVTNEVEMYRWIADGAAAKLAEGDRAACDKFGASLVSCARSWEQGGNAVAAILEEYRANYRIVFAAPAAQTTLPGVMVNAATGRIASVVDEAERVVRAAQNAQKMQALRQTQPAVATAQPQAKLDIPQGTFTITHAGSDVYETVQLETIVEPGHKFEGKTIASYLTGPDNSTSFRGFAFVSDNGQVHVWKRFAGIDMRWINAVATVIGAEREAQLDAREAYAQRSGKCSVCARKLTVPASLHRGMGPICAERMGI